MKGLSRPTLLSLLLSAVSVAGLAVCLCVHYSNIVVNWSTTKDVFDVLKNFAEIVAIFGGATWALFKFFKSRTFQENLGLKISGTIIPISGVNYLSINAQLKNIGSSDVKVQEQGTAISVWRYKQSPNLLEVDTVDKEAIAGFPVFKRDAVIGRNGPETVGTGILCSLEPGESIEDEKLIALIAPVELALRIELSVTASKYTWEAATIVLLSQPSEAKEQ